MSVSLRLSKPKTWVRCMIVHAQRLQIAFGGPGIDALNMPS